MRRNKCRGVAIPAVDISELGFADANRVLQHCLEHWLKIARRAADNLKHLRRRRLLLQRFVQFAGKPSDLCLLASRGRIGTCTAFGALRRFGSGVLRRRPLIGSPPALERLFIASPVG